MSEQTIKKTLEDLYKRMNLSRILTTKMEIKKALMLRAEVPPDYERITFDSLSTNDDMWTHLFSEVCWLHSVEEAEIWHYMDSVQVKPRVTPYSEAVTERWIPDLTKEDVSEYDLIWARGGLQPYLGVLNRARPDAFKIYYGAGKRFFPVPSIASWLQNKPPFYDLVLVDSIEQKKVIEETLPDQRVSQFIKPAADNIFYPMPKVVKEFDVCVAFQLASYTKRFELAMDSIMAGGFSALVVGQVPDNIIYQIQEKHPKIVFAGRVSRKRAVELYNRCKVGLATHSQLESCPRVIPEFLACGLPIVVTKDTLFWREKYITRSTGCLTHPNVDSIVKSLTWALQYRHMMKPREHYMESLNNKEAGYFLAKVIAGALPGINT